MIIKKTFEKHPQIELHCSLAAPVNQILIPLLIKVWKKLWVTTVVVECSNNCLDIVEIQYCTKLKQLPIIFTIDGL